MTKEKVRYSIKLIGAMIGATLVFVLIALPFIVVTALYLFGVYFVLSYWEIFKWLKYVLGIDSCECCDYTHSESDLFFNRSEDNE